MAKPKPDPAGDDDLDPSTYPPDPKVPEGSYLGLPSEAGDADPQPLKYGDLPGKEYTEGEDFREAQQRAVKSQFGEFAPSGDEEAKDGG